MGWISERVGLVKMEFFVLVLVQRGVVIYLSLPLYLCWVLSIEC